MQSKYWRRVAARAWGETIQALRLNSRARIVTAFLTALIAAAVLLFWGSQDAASDMALERGAIWALVILAFPFVYAWHFVTAPAKIDDEKNNNIETLHTQLATVSVALAQKVASRSNVLTLSVLLEKGYVLGVERITLDEFEQWVERLRKWEVLTQRYIATAFSHQDAVTFQNVRYHMRENFIFKVNEEHNRELQQHMTRMETFREIIGRYKENWSPISSAERSHIETILAVFEAQVIAPDSDQTLNEESS